MKASFVMMLLAISVCAGAVKFPGLVSAPPFLTFKRGLATAFDEHNRQVLSTSPVNKKYYPYTTTDFGYRRTGNVYASQRSDSFEQCFQFCRADASHCVAINYQHQVRTCQKLSTLGGFATSCSYVTCLVNYKVSDDPCSEAYFQNSFKRPGFFYKQITIVGTKASRECCLKCKADPGSKCKSWTYYASRSTCFLRDLASPLRFDSDATSGFGVVESAYVAQ